MRRRGGDGESCYEGTRSNSGVEGGVHIEILQSSNEKMNVIFPCDGVKVVINEIFWKITIKTGC